MEFLEDTAFHLFCRLIGKSDGKNMPVGIPVL